MSVEHLTRREIVHHQSLPLKDSNRGPRQNSSAAEEETEADACSEEWLDCVLGISGYVVCGHVEHTLTVDKTSFSSTEVLVYAGVD